MCIQCLVVNRCSIRCVNVTFLSDILTDMKTYASYCKDLKNRNVWKFREPFGHMMSRHNASCCCFEEPDFQFVLICSFVSVILKISNSKCPEKHYFGCLGDGYLQQYTFFDSHFFHSLFTNLLSVQQYVFYCEAYKMIFRHGHSFKTFRTPLVIVIERNKFKSHPNCTWPNCGPYLVRIKSSKRLIVCIRNLQVHAFLNYLSKILDNTSISKSNNMVFLRKRYINKKKAMLIYVYPVYVNN